MRTRLSRIALLGFFMVAPMAWGVENLVITAPEVPVYASPSITSPVITVLKKGQQVPAGINPAEGFKKVLVLDATHKKVIGYVALGDLKGGIFSDQGDKQKKKKKGDKATVYGLRRHWALGLNVGADYQYRGSSTITDQGGDSAAVTGLSGTNLKFGLQLDIPVKPQFSFEVDLEYKNVSLTGTGPADGGTTPSAIVDSINYYALGLTGKFYAGVNSDWWFGPGIEYDYVSSGTLQIGSRPTYTWQSSELKSLYMVSAATGYDFMSSKNFYITPSFRLGALVNATPLTLELDMVLSGIYRF